MKKFLVVLRMILLVLSFGNVDAFYVVVTDLDLPSDAVTTHINQQFIQMKLSFFLLVLLSHSKI